jgi:hypothetical protein
MRWDVNGNVASFVYVGQQLSANKLQRLWGGVLQLALGSSSLLHNLLCHGHLWYDIANQMHSPFDSAGMACQRVRDATVVHHRRCTSRLLVHSFGGRCSAAVR